MWRRARTVGRRASQVLGLTVACVLTAASLGAAGSSAVVPAPSQQAFGQAMSAALTATRLPAKLTPTLQQLIANPYVEEGTIEYVRPSCDPYDHTGEAQHPTPCWFGDTSSTAPVIAIFGDSFVGNWMPALDSAAKLLGYRVAVFEFKGCYTAFTPSATEPGFDQAQVAACDVWHSTLGLAVRRLHPKVVIAANGTPSWRTTQSAWVRGMQLAFHDLDPAGSRVDILLGTGVHLPEGAPACLASNPDDLQACTFHYTASSSTGLAFARDATVAAEVPHLHLIPTYQWVCQDDACPLVVAHVVVYADDQHLTIAYSSYLSHLFFLQLRAVLHAAGAPT